MKGDGAAFRGDVFVRSGAETVKLSPESATRYMVTGFGVRGWRGTAHEAA